MKRIVLIAVLVILGATVAFGSFMVYRIGPRNVIGMLRYDQRRDGDLKVGDRAPDALLMSLDGKERVSLLGERNGRPLVVVFGSFT